MSIKNLIRILAASRSTTSTLPRFIGQRGPLDDDLIPDSSPTDPALAAPTNTDAVLPPEFCFACSYIPTNHYDGIVSVAPLSSLYIDSGEYTQSFESESGASIARQHIPMA